MATAATYPQWEYDVLAGIGAPASPANLEALYGWANSEGTASSNNPLAVSGKANGATKCLAQCGSTSPIYAYGTEAEGVAANVAFLKQPNYVGIINAFTKNKGLQSIYSAINSSKWCSGCQGGKYPAGLLTLVNGGSVSAAGAATATSGIGSLIPGGGSSAAASGCAWGIKFGSLGQVCLLSSGQVKAVTGAAALVAGSGLAILGIVMAAAAVGGKPAASAAQSIRHPIKSSTSGSRSGGKSTPKALQLPKTPANDDNERIAHAQGLAQGQSTNPEYQAQRKSYLSQRESKRRAGAPLTKSSTRRKAAPSVAGAKAGRTATVAKTVAKNPEVLAAF